MSGFLYYQFPLFLLLYFIRSALLFSRRHPFIEILSNSLNSGKPLIPATPKKPYWRSYRLRVQERSRYYNPVFDLEAAEPRFDLDDDGRVHYSDFFLFAPPKTNFRGLERMKERLSHGIIVAVARALFKRWTTSGKRW